MSNANDFVDRLADSPDEYFESEDLPTSESFYVELAQQLFPGSMDDEAADRRYKFVMVLRRFLRIDGRTIRALIYVAGQARQHPDDYDGCGVNALAGVVGYLRRTTRQSIDPGLVTELETELPELANNHRLEHNARLALNYLLNRP